MEGEVQRRSFLSAGLLGSKRLQIDNERSSRRDVESSDVRAMSQQLSMAQRSNWRWFLLNKFSLKKTTLEVEWMTQHPSSK